jgi:hypothetical protein
MVISLNQTGSIFTIEEAVLSVKNPGWLFYLNYGNAMILTLLITAFFAGLYHLVNTTEPELAVSGMVFIPVYCVLNFFIYASQITVIPNLMAASALEAGHFPINIIIGQMVQAWPGSSIAIFNNLAYAILAIPSLTFGFALIQRLGSAVPGGWFLIFNGIASIIGGLGIVLRRHPAPYWGEFSFSLRLLF